MTQSPTTVAHQTLKSYRIGDLDESGRLVIYNVTSGMGSMPMLLETAYGVVLINDGDEKKPKPRYIVAFRKERRVVDTHSLAEFRRALNQIPKGTTVHRHDTCTILRSWGLTEAQFAAYERSFRRAKLRVPDTPRITCYCAISG